MLASLWSPDRHSRQGMVDGLLRRRPPVADTIRAMTDVGRATRGLDEVTRLLSDALATLTILGLTEEAHAVASVLHRLRPDADIAWSTLRRRGDVWTVLYGRDAFQLRDSRGLHYLSALLRQPHVELHVLDLVGSSPSISLPPMPAVDADARRAYRARIRELEEDLTDAERNADREQVAKLTEEREFLLEQLAGSTGIGGRPRGSATAAERARQAVTKALKSTLERISAESPTLGHHLAATLRTGTFCRYAPDPRIPIRWSVETG